MHSVNSSDIQEDMPKQGFIEQARRKQIVAATIEVLAKYGYVNTSFARISKEAGISPSLISYHFRDKTELTEQVIVSISTDRVAHTHEKLTAATTATDKLRIALEADLANMGTQPQRFQAMVEVLFGSRGATGSIAYLGDNEDPALTLLREILDEGQRNGEFKDFDTTSMAIILDGARDTFLAQLTIRPGFQLETFTKTLIAVALQAVLKEDHE